MRASSLDVARHKHAKLFFEDWAQEDDDDEEARKRVRVRFLGLGRQEQEPDRTPGIEPGIEGTREGMAARNNNKKKKPKGVNELQAYPKPK